MVNTYDIISEKCKVLGITVGRMCSEIGISQGVLSDLKKGRTKNLSAQNLQKISTYLQCTTSELLGETETKIQQLQSDHHEKVDALRVLGLNQEAYSVALSYQRADMEHKRIVRSTLALEDMPFPAESEHTSEAM